MRVIISVFILFHCGATLLWNAPDSYVRSKLLPPIEPYLRFTCLAQSWSMFAPNPGLENNYMEPLVTFSDGTQWALPFTRQSTLKFWPQLINERFRKLGESVWAPAEDNSWYVYPDICLWAARKGKERYPARTPVRVDLMRRWNVIPDLPHGLESSFNPIWQSDCLYTITLDPEARL